MGRKKEETKATETKVVKPVGSKKKENSKKPTTKKEEVKIESAVVEEYDPAVDDFYDEELVRVVLEGLASLSKDTKESVATVNDKEIRFIIDNYYATQQHRINIAGQVRAVMQGYDKIQEGEQPAIAWLLKDVENRENQIKKMIMEYVKKEPVCRWAMAIKGIGPVFAANLWSYIDMNRCHHANQFHAYAGLNDNNTPWLGKDKAKEIVENAYKHFGLKPGDPVNDDVFLRVATLSGRSVTSVKNGFKNHVDKIQGKKPSDKTSLMNYMAKIPYNADLKKMCYLIGESFVKNSNRGSLYGEIYKERKAYENMKNERGDYREQAEMLLAEKNYKQDKDTYKLLSEGKLSPGHINARAKRYAVKIFLTHFFEACWIYTHKTNPPTIYPISHLGHVDYIEPEVPYEDYLIWDHSK